MPALLFVLYVPSNNIFYIYIQAGRKKLNVVCLKTFVVFQFILTMNDPYLLKIDYYDNYGHFRIQKLQ